MAQAVAEERIAFLKHDLQGKAQRILQLERELEESASAKVGVERVLHLRKEIECRDKRISELEGELEREVESTPKRVAGLDSKAAASETAGDEEGAGATSPGVDAEMLACIQAELEAKEQRIAELMDERAGATAAQAATMGPSVEQLQSELQKSGQRIAEIERAIQNPGPEGITLLREVVVQTYCRIQVIHTEEGARSAAEQKAADAELTHLRVELADKSQQIRALETRTPACRSSCAPSMPSTTDSWPSCRRCRALRRGLCRGDPWRSCRGCLSGSGNGATPCRKGCCGWRA